MMRQIPVELSPKALKSLGELDNNDREWVSNVRPHPYPKRKGWKEVVIRDEDALSELLGHLLEERKKP